MLSIAFDGLDPTLVKKFNLEGLTQRQHGVVDVSEAAFTKKITPAIVSVHLTGTTEYVPKFRELFKAGNTWLPFLDTLHDMGGRTIADEMENARIINLPSRKPAKKAMRKAMREKDEEAWLEKKEAELEVLGEQKKKLIEWINTVEKPRLLWNWFFFPDDLEHIKFGNLEEMEELYKIVEETFLEVKECIPEGELILLWSDHGFYRIGNSEMGLHSEEGFWSTNREVSLKRPTHIDLYNFEKERLIREEENYVTNTLKDLGYFG